MENCIFCKIVNREIPGHILFENEDVLVFLDISQATKGHTLIIPKVHCDDIFMMDEELSARVFSVVPKIARALKVTFGATGINLLNNNGKDAGQEVFHYHIHLIPRYPGDGVKFKLPNNTSQTDSTTLSALKEEILLCIN